MNIIPSLAPPSCFQIGIRAVSKPARRTLCAVSARQLSTAFKSFPEPCRGNQAAGPLGLVMKVGHGRKIVPRVLSQTVVRTVFTFRAIVHYTKLPDDYEDASGLPFRKEDLNQKDVKRVFGPHITAPEANRLLKIIHGRRVAGTLDDPDLQENTAHYSSADKVKALEYLRENIPVDEIINAGLRAEDELRLLEEKERNGEVMEAQHEETSPQHTPSDEAVSERRPNRTGRLPRETDSAYGEGVFDRIRKRNEARYEEEQRLLEEERIKREEEEALRNIGTLQTQQVKPKQISPWRKKHTERATSELEAPPELAAWERLLPATAFTLLVLAAAAVFAASYMPPRRSYRIWPDIPPAAATCIGLVLANLAVFALWKFPPAWVVFNKYMLVIPATPRPFQLIGAMFSHQTFWHLAVNMVGLWIFGTRLHEEIGRGNFLALYVASGTIGFLTSLFNLVLTRGLFYTTHGASGAIYGVIAAFFWIHRDHQFKFFGLPQDPLSGPPGAVFLGIIIGLHVWLGLFSKSPAAFELDIASHVGGIVAGAIAIELIQRSRDFKAMTRAEKLGVIDNRSIQSRSDIPGSFPQLMHVRPRPDRYLHIGDQVNIEKKHKTEVEVEVEEPEEEAKDDVQDEEKELPEAEEEAQPAKSVKS